MINLDNYSPLSAAKWLVVEHRNTEACQRTDYVALFLSHDDAEDYAAASTKRFGPGWTYTVEQAA